MNIPYMTAWQFAHAIKNIGLFEKHTQGDSRSSAPVTLGQVPGQVPRSIDIRRMAQQIDPTLKIPPEK